MYAVQARRLHVDVVMSGLGVSVSRTAAGCLRGLDGCVGLCALAFSRDEQGVSIIDGI